MVHIPSKVKSEIVKRLEFLYGNQAYSTFKELKEILNIYGMIIIERSANDQSKTNLKDKFTRKDIILNSYANSIKGKSSNPLKDLYNFSFKYLKEIINGIHILPFYKWDTDRGFSVLDYYKVDPRNGTWKQFTSLNKVFDILMVDCVLNHASIDNPIVQKALIGYPDYLDFVITFSDNEKPNDEILQKITRARPTPVLTRYYVVKDENQFVATFNKPATSQIVKSGWIWTTFSRPNNSDGSISTKQVDLNYQNPKLLLEIINLISFYISKGANWIRLDAVGYLWKKLGTSCLHQPETFIVIELLALIFNAIEDNSVVLISEVNEPQERALQYLGSNSHINSDMVYLFTHFPLAVHSILTGSAVYYKKWLPSLVEAKGRLFISVLGSHDGMGMKPIGNWLPEVEKNKLEKILVEEHGALPNYAKLPGSKKIIYELCSTPWNFVNKDHTSDSIQTQINRYIAVFALGLMLKGVPSIYINGLLGIPNYKGALDENRSINRQILREEDLESKLENQTSVMSSIFSKIKKLIAIRQKEKAFDLNGSFKVIHLHKSVVSILLSSHTQLENIFALVNVSNSQIKVQINHTSLRFERSFMIDLLSELQYDFLNPLGYIELKLLPYQICWLR